MSTVSWRKVAGWSGVGFSVVFLASEINLADTPTLDQPAAVFREWFETNTSQIAWTTLGVALSTVFFFLLFASGLRGHLEPVDVKNAGLWSRLSFSSAIVMVAIGGAKAGVWPALSHPDVLPAASDGIIKTLASVEVFMLVTVLPWVFAVFLLGVCVVILQSGIMARWLGWFGLSVALLFVVGSFWVATGESAHPLGVLPIVGYLGFVAWVVGVATSLLRSDRGTNEVTS